LRRLSESGERFNVIFADPPYAKKPGDTDYAQWLVSSAHLRGVLAPRGLFVLETMVTKHDSGAIAGWDVLRDRAYGSTRILILQDPTSDHAEGPRAADLQPAPATGPPRDGSRSMEEDAAAGRAGV
jgi:16S rRNA (guanine966-N2)-methyltransferase